MAQSREGRLRAHFYSYGTHERAQGTKSQFARSGAQDPAGLVDGRPILCASSRIARLDAAAAVQQEGDDGTDQENDKQNFGDPGSACRDAAKSEHGGYQGDNQEDDSVVKHDCTVGSCEDNLQ